MKIYDAQVNHLTNPLGFRMARTVFSWKTEGGHAAAAQVLAASDPDFKNILSDTGMKEDFDSLGTELELPLSPRTRYYWKVFVRTSEGDTVESAPCFFETAKRDEPWQAEWIGCDFDDRHPIFEKKVSLEKEISSARLYICGLGLYEAFLNGKRIGNEYFTPYCNDYTSWIQYQTYDITDDLKAAGPEADFGVLLGNGWYKGRFGFRKSTKGYYGDSWKLIAEIRIAFADGTETVIGTDPSWTVKKSRITFSNIYDGEYRDDTLPEEGAGNAVKTDAPKGALSERMSLPVVIKEKLQPVELIHTPAGEKVLDLGQEITGIFALRVHEKKGMQIRIQTGEILQGGNFYNANLRSARSEYRYVCGEDETILIPHFIFYGYRYVKIEGIADLKKEDFTALALYSDISDKGFLTTGHDLVNRLISNVRWGMRDNFLDVPTDCPQRDERMGWTGDAQVFSTTAIYLADTYAFYAKFLKDMDYEQKELDGKVPDVIPDFGVTSTACVWGDAACIIPWNLYVFYGDIRILEDQYDSMRSWVEYIRRTDGNDHAWRREFHYGDWLALDHPNHHAEQVFGGTDVEFIAAVYYAASARILAKTAELLGKKEDAKFYSELSEKEFADVKREYYSPTGRCCIKTQTALILTLKYHLSDNTKLVVSQLRELFKDCDDKLRTGFVGTPLLCNVLSDYGMDDLACKLLLNEEFPGWLREVKLGATTIWERWNSLLDDGTISGISMNSMNHYSYGSILEWMFRRLAGLNFTEEVAGCRSVRIAPVLNWELKHVDASYDSPAGRYLVSWKILDQKHVTVKVSIPDRTKALLVLPCDLQKREIALDSESAEYTYETDRCLKPGFNVDMEVGKLLAVPEISEKLNSYYPVSKIAHHHYKKTLRELAEKSKIVSEEELEELNRFLETV